MIKFIIVLIIVVAILYGVLSIFLKFLSPKNKLPKGGASLFFGIVLFVFYLTVTVVGPQEVGVVVGPGGVKEAELHSGWHIVAPWNSVSPMDKTVWVYTFSQKGGEGEKRGDDAIWVSTKDGIKIGLDVSISWRIDPEFGSWIYSNVSENDGGSAGRYLWLEENVIRAKAKSAIALAVSQFTPIEAYSNKREEIRNISFRILQKELMTYHLVLDQVDLREVFYNQDYEKAINEKKLAEQKVLTLIEVTKQKEEELKQAEINKNIAIQKAEGEAKALQIKGSSIASNPKVIQLEWINKWNGALPVYMMGNGQGVILNLDNK